MRVTVRVSGRVKLCRVTCASLESTIPDCPQILNDILFQLSLTEEDPLNGSTYKWIYPKETYLLRPSATFSRNGTRLLGGTIIIHKTAQPCSTLPDYAQNAKLMLGVFAAFRSKFPIGGKAIQMGLLRQTQTA